MDNRLRVDTIRPRKPFASYLKLSSLTVNNLFPPPQDRLNGYAWNAGVVSSRFSAVRCVVRQPDPPQNLLILGTLSVTTAHYVLVQRDTIHLPLPHTRVPVQYFI